MISRATCQHLITSHMKCGNLKHPQTEPDIVRKTIFSNVSFDAFSFGQSQSECNQTVLTPLQVDQRKSLHQYQLDNDIISTINLTKTQVPITVLAMGEEYFCCFGYEHSCSWYILGVLRNVVCFCWKIQDTFFIQLCKIRHCCISDR